MQNLQGSHLETLMQKCVEEYVLNGHPDITVKNLRNLLRRFFVWLDGRELTVKECRLYIKDMKRRLAHSSAASDTGRLKMFLKWLHYDAEETPYDWSRDVRRPKIVREADEPEQLLAPEKLVELVMKVTKPGKHDHKGHREAKKEHREFLFFYMKMGLRPSEAINIKPQHVNLDGSPPSVQIQRKGGKWQTLGLPLDYLQPIEARVKAGRWFAVSQTTLQRYMRKVSQLAGKKISLYSIRKSNDTFLLDNGAPLMHAAIHQGHTVAIMQKHYVRFSGKQSSEVLNTFGPYIDRAKLPVEYTLKHIDHIVEKVRKHPAFKVQKNERSLIIEW